MISMPKALLVIVLALVLVCGGALFLLNKFVFQRFTDIPVQVFTQNVSPAAEHDDAPPLTTYVRDRRVIWAIDFLPDGRMIFTERAGTVSVVETNGEVNEVASVHVHTTSESGLHGIAVDPKFSENRFVYLYYTYRSDDMGTQNRVSRYVLEDTGLAGETIIVDNIPGASTHDGGRLKFGPDGFLYITTGDAQAPSLSQDQASLAGKILRVTRDGAAAPGNPFNTRIYSFGHRNPQGIAWDNDGKLWATEHGPSARDELNLIEAGGNYGWPELTGTDTKDGFQSPIIQSGAGTWAPGGLAFAEDAIFFSGLRGSALYEYNHATGELTEHLKDNLGRIRDVVLGPDGSLYIATSNHDGRGVPTRDDDRILRINLQKLDEL